MGFVEDAAGEEPVGGQMISYDACDLKMPPDLKDIVHNLIDGFFDLLV